MGNMSFISKSMCHRVNEFSGRTAQVVIAAIQCDDGLTASLVAAVRWGSVRWTSGTSASGHRAASWGSNPVPYRIC